MLVRYDKNVRVLYVYQYFELGKHFYVTKISNSRIFVIVLKKISLLCVKFKLLRMAESTTQTANVIKRVAIIGAGPSGFVALRWSLARGLQPTAFECAAAVGGVWNLTSYALSQPYRWPSNNTNTSKYALTFSGEQYPADSPMFPLKQQMNAYIGRYADHFELRKFVRFRHLVTRIEVLPTENEESLMGVKWTVHFRRLDDGVPGSETFDFLIMAAGIAGKPYIPAEFLSKLTGPNARFRGQFFHCPGNAPAEWDYEMENHQSDQ